jgi:hypothetical protein
VYSSYLVYGKDSRQMKTVTTAEFVARISVGRVKPVLPMIAEHARATWFKLPDSEKMVRSLPDLISEGINFTVTHVAIKFDSRRGVKFTTFLYHALDNFYADIIRKVYTDKRLIPHGVMSIDSTRVCINGREMSLMDKVKLTRRTRLNNEEKIINRIDAERMFIKAYRNASPLLRKYLIKWLLQPRVSRNKPGADFAIAKREFKKVARPYLIPELCDTIQNDWICRATIAGVVADRFHTVKKQSRTGFLNTEEFAVAPILGLSQITHLIPTIG